MVAVTSLDRGRALKAERAQMLAFCGGLGPAEWRMNSRAPGWRIQDVVAHLGSACHALLMPAAVKLMRANDIERANDAMVQARQDWPYPDVFAEYKRWSGVVVAVLPAVARTPLGGVAAPLAELGRFPMRLLTSALVFDHHTHLRHDMAPAVDRPVPCSDANRMAVVLEWMMAVLSNQLRATRPPWLVRPVAITLSGPGGGTWLVTADGSVVARSEASADAQIRGVALEFPEWGTARTGWRERDVQITGDVDYGTTFLDALNIV